VNGNSNGGMIAGATLNFCLDGPGDVIPGCDYGWADKIWVVAQANGHWVRCATSGYQTGDSFTAYGGSNDYNYCKSLNL
jgi:hypothetical protein